MILSRRCEYGLRAALFLASRSDAPVPVREVSTALGIPNAFLAKTVRDLVQAGIVASQSGARGGLTLARPAGSVVLKDVVVAIDGPDLFETCVLHLPGCGELAPCPLHGAWVVIRDRIEAMLAGETLEAAAEATRAHGFRIVLPAGADR